MYVCIQKCLIDKAANERKQQELVRSIEIEFAVALNSIFYAIWSNSNSNDSTASIAIIAASSELP